MNARIETIRNRNARSLNTFGLNAEQIRSIEFQAQMREIMLLTEFLDRTLLDLDCYTYTQVYVYGKAVQIIRGFGLDYSISANGYEFGSIMELANEAVDWAFGVGLVDPFALAS